MIHTAQFYINISETEKVFLENKYEDDISQVYSRINNIYKSKGIVINYISNFVNTYTVFFTIDFIKLLEKSRVNEDDIFEINNEISNFKFDIINNKDIEEVLIRIDYRFDSVINSKDRETLLYLYNKTVDKFGFKKKFNEYDTTIYFNSKSIQSKVYDKETERIDNVEVIEDYEKDVLRFEVAIRNQHLNYNKRAHKMDKSINIYLNNSLCKTYMKNSLEVFLYKGDYYTIYKAKKIIVGSNIKERYKEEVIEFIKYISNYGVTKAQQQYSKYKCKKYLNILSELNINPILIPKNLKGSSTYIKNPFNLSA